MAQGSFPTVVYLLRYKTNDVTFLSKLASQVIPGGLPELTDQAPARRDAYIAGRAALALACEVAGKPLFVEPDPKYGYLRTVDSTGHGFKGIFANLSHTQNMAVAAIGQSSLGIDVESSTRNVSKVLARVATPTECENLPTFCINNSLPQVALWSAKEAFAKAWGVGFQSGFLGFLVDLQGTGPFSGRTHLAGPLSLRDPALEFRVFEGFLVALCTERSDLEQGVQWRFAEASELPR